VLCFGVRTASHIAWSSSKTAGRFFLEKKVVKRCTEYRHQKKTTPFLKNSDDGTILSDGGTTIFFISDDGCMNNCIF
jgi:hypothetical protein